MERLCRWLNVFPSGACLFCTRRAFQRAGGFDQNYYAAEELVWVAALKRQGRVTILAETVVTSGRKAREQHRTALEAPGDAGDRLSDERQPFTPQPFIRGAVLLEPGALVVAREASEKAVGGGAEALESAHDPLGSVWSAVRGQFKLSQLPVPTSVSTTPPPPVAPDGPPPLPPARPGVVGTRRFGPPEQGVILRGLYIGRALLAVVVMIRSALVRDVAPELAFTGMMVVLTSFAVTSCSALCAVRRASRSCTLPLFPSSPGPAILPRVAGAESGGARRAGGVQ